MRTMSVKTTTRDLEKNKRDDLHDYILDIKATFGRLPTNLCLDSSRIPNECRATMSIKIDDIDIPIIEMGGRPC